MPFVMELTIHRSGLGVRDVRENIGENRVDPVLDTASCHHVNQQINTFELEVAAISF